MINTTGSNPLEAIIGQSKEELDKTDADVRREGSVSGHNTWMVDKIISGTMPGFIRNDHANVNPSLFPIEVLEEARDKSMTLEEVINFSLSKIDETLEHLSSNGYLQFLNPKQKENFENNASKLKQAYEELKKDGEGFKSWLELVKGSGGKTPLANKNDNWGEHAQKIFRFILNEKKGNLFEVKKELESTREDFLRIRKAQTFSEITNELTRDQETRELLTDIHNGWRNMRYGIDQTNELTLDNGEVISITFDAVLRFEKFASHSSIIGAAVHNLEMFELGLTQEHEDFASWLEERQDFFYNELTINPKLPSVFTFYLFIEKGRIFERALTKISDETVRSVIINARDSELNKLKLDANMGFINGIIHSVESRIQEAKKNVIF